MCACSWGEQFKQDVTCLFVSVVSQAVSRAECPETCQSMVGAVPGPLVSGRRFVEDPGSSGNGALPLNPAHDLEAVQPWMRMMKGQKPGGL